jgi:hypothetical protein
MPIVATDPFSQTSIFIKMKFGETELATGTAFFYRRNGELYLVSNWHNLSGRNPETKQPLSKHGGVPDRIFCYVCLNEPYLKRAWLELPLAVDNEANWFEHPTHGGGIDIGVLPLALSERYRAIVLNEQVFTKMTLRVSHDVFVLGYPLGILGTHGMPIWKRATVATEPATSEAHFYVDTATRSGMSGSPVIFRYRGFYKNDPTAQEPADDDWFGEGDMFVGVYSGRLAASSVEAQLGIVWKAHLIDEIIDGQKTADC